MQVKYVDKFICKADRKKRTVAKNNLSILQMKGVQISKLQGSQRKEIAVK